MTGPAAIVGYRSRRNRPDPEDPMTTRRETKSFPIAGVKAVDTETGTFEAFVAVFGNVDYHGDRIAAGAFADSLERWKASGDPVPIIFSHQWHDLSSYLGEADPADIEEVPAGDPRLPAVIADYGGLLVKGRLDVSEPEGRKAAKLLKNRTVREFSFAYDILDEARGSDGFNELLELDLIEAGPTLKGANPLTQLVAAKAASDPAVAEALDVLTAALADLDPAAAPPPSRSGKAKGSKAWVTPDGTIERRLEALRGELIGQALDRYGEELYELHVEGTFDDRVLFYVELWADPYGGGVNFEAPYTLGDDGPEIGDWQGVELRLDVVPRGANAGDRFRRKEGRRNANADQSRIQSIHDLTCDLGASCVDPDGATDGEPDEADAGEPDGAAARSSSAAVIAATLEAELLDL